MAKKKRKQILNAALKALIAGAETSAAIKIPAAFISELAALPDDKQKVLAELSQEQFNALLTQSELATLNAAEAAAGTKQIKALIKELSAKIDKLTIIDRREKERALIHNLPYPSIGDLFKGRDDILKKLKSRLDDNKPIAITQAIEGLGGIGKTRLVVEYAWRAIMGKEYNAVFFINAVTPKSFHASLASLAEKEMLNLTERGVDQQAADSAVLRWLSANNGWLMIIDNANTNESVKAVESLLPHLTKGHIIITSRFRRWSATVWSQSLGLLGSNDAKEFLLDRTADRRIKSDDDKKLAKKLAKKLGCLPLTLEQAAAYISYNQCSFADYLNQWDSERPNVLNWYDERQMQYPACVAITWQRTFEQLSPPARTLLRLSAFLAPEIIPSKMFEKKVNIITEAMELLADEKPVEQSEFKIDDALAELAAYSMITRQKEGFTVPRIIQQVIRSRIPEESRADWIKMSLQIVNDFAPGNSSDIRTWPVYDILRPHAELIARTADQAQITEPTSRLMNQLGLYLYAKGLYSEADPLMRKALKIDEASLGPDHPDVAICLNNLAQLLQATNRLSEAEPLMKRALKIDEDSFGPDHPNVAKHLNNLALLLQATNRLSEAEPMMRRVLKIDDASFGPDHPNVSRGLNNLAHLLAATDRLSEAEPMYRRALKIDEVSFGPDHPNVATDLNNLAVLLEATNRLSEAEPLMRRALKIDEASFGPDHPDVARDLNNLAALLEATNRLSEAEPMYRRALKIDEASFGPDHTNVARDLNNLAQLLQATNRLSEAEPMYRRALKIGEASFGPNHPEVAIRLNNLAQLLQATNRLSEAEPMMRRVLKIDEASFGPDHPNVSRGLNNLAHLLAATDRLSEAEPMYRRALKIDEASFGPEHPKVAIRLNNLALLLESTNRLSEAEPMMRRALKILEDSLGLDHPTTETIRNNLQTLK